MQRNRFTQLVHGYLNSPSLRRCPIALCRVVCGDQGLIQHAADVLTAMLSMLQAHSYLYSVVLC